MEQSDVCLYFLSSGSRHRLPILTATPLNISHLEGFKDVTTTSRPVDFVLPPWDYRENLVAQAIYRHLECKRRGGSRLANPYKEAAYQTRPPFHVTFYEMVSDVEIFFEGKRTCMTVHQTNERIGTLYGRQDTRSTASRTHSTSDNAKQQLNERAFRQSAVTVCLPMLCVYLICANANCRFLRSRKRRFPR